MSATKTSSIWRLKARRRRQMTKDARVPTAAAPMVQGSQSADPGLEGVAGRPTDSTSIRGPDTRTGRLPLPSVKSRVNTKLATPEVWAASRVIPRTIAPPGDTAGSVQVYRLDPLVRGKEPLSEMKVGPLGRVVLSHPIPDACPVFRIVRVRMNRDVAFTRTAEAFMPRVSRGAQRTTALPAVDGRSRFPFLSVAVHVDWVPIERPSSRPRRTTRWAVRAWGPGARFDRFARKPSVTFVTGTGSSRYSNRKWPPRVQFDHA